MTYGKRTGTYQGIRFQGALQLGGHLPARGAGTTLTIELREGCRARGMGGRSTANCQADALPGDSTGRPAESHRKQMVIKNQVFLGYYNKVRATPAPLGWAPQG